MKRYRLKKDFRGRLAFLPKGATSDVANDEYAMFRIASDGSAFYFERNEFDEWLEEVKESACFTHEDLKEAFEAGRGTMALLEDVYLYGGLLELKFPRTYPTFEDYLKSKKNN